MAKFKKLFDLLTPAERGRAVLLVAVILVMALLDVVGVASIMPFMAVLANPQLVQTNSFLAKLYQFSGTAGVQGFLFTLGLLVFVLLVISLIFKALTTYALVRFTLMRECSIGQRLFAAYLHQPYVWFLNRHSAELGKTILSEVTNVVHGGLVPMMTLIAQSFVSAALILLLFFVDPVLALSVCAALGASYLIVYRFMKRYLSNIGKERLDANRARFSVVSEALGAVKEVKLGGLEESYLSRFAKPANIYAKDNAAAHMVAQLPRFALEAVAFGGMLLLVLYLMVSSGDFTSAIPIVAVYALAGYRLMPALQQVYASISQLRFAGPAIEALHEDLVGLPQPPLQINIEGKLKLERLISLKNIEFAYPNSQKLALLNINLDIPARSTIGLVGVTGSGKTTLVDLILGLLEPQRGSFIIDNHVSIGNENRCAWQRMLGYVPQQIYLIDDSVAANIAFGVNTADIDWDALHRAAKIANLHEFVMNDLVSEYQTLVGERGVRLSGGQRQRIGIARALYHKPQILILDEATSALDNLTEQAVMEAVNNLHKDITIILIAHRLSTVRLCDQIILLEKGEIKARGNFTQLMEESQAFRAMATVKE
jgi:ABC-type multidrug transport system fused ATPase/permease subunit